MSFGIKQAKWVTIIAWPISMIAEALEYIRHGFKHPFLLVTLPILIIIFTIQYYVLRDAYKKVAESEKRKILKRDVDNQ